MKRICLLILVLLLNIFNLLAQTTNDITELSVGDKVPDITFHNVMNFRKASLKLSDFTGKLVILDFFGTWCGSCIAALPRLDSLQQQLKDKVQVLVVTQEPVAAIARFLSGNSIASSTGLVFVAGDSLLHQYFPHRLIPHEVWLNTTGEVAAITAPDKVTSANILTLYNGQSLKLSIKKDLMDFDRNQPLMGSKGGALRSGSMITGYIDGVGTLMGTALMQDSNLRRSYYINMPLLELYNITIGYKLPSNRVLFENMSATGFLRTHSSWEDWAVNHAFCYELVAPANIPREERKQWMLADLNRTFELNARLAKRQTDCLVLQRDTSVIKVVKPLPAYGMEMKTIPLPSLLAAMNKLYGGQQLFPIIIDSTNYQGKVTVAMPPSGMPGLERIKQDLQTQGFYFHAAKKELDMLIISGGY